MTQSLPVIPKNVEFEALMSGFEKKQFCAPNRTKFRKKLAIAFFLKQNLVTFLSQIFMKKKHFPKICDKKVKKILRKIRTGRSKTSRASWSLKMSVIWHFYLHKREDLWPFLKNLQLFVFFYLGQF
jgi:hypothetical protein